MPLLKAFSAEKITLQKKKENKSVRTDVSFSEHKGVVEIDEKGHTDKNQNEEDERQSKMKKPS